MRSLLNKKQQKNLIRILVATAMMVALLLIGHFLPVPKMVMNLLFLAPYLIVGYDVLKKAGIGKWDREYPASGEGIEDAVRWKVKLTEDDREYVSKGEESFEPYDYEVFMDALRILEDRADYFLAREK